MAGDIVNLVSFIMFYIGRLQILFRKLITDGWLQDLTMVSFILVIRARVPSSSCGTTLSDKVESCTPHIGREANLQTVA